MWPGIQGTALLPWLTIFSGPSSQRGRGFGMQACRCAKQRKELSIDNCGAKVEDLSHALLGLIDRIKARV